MSANGKLIWFLRNVYVFSFDSSGPFVARQTSGRLGEQGTAQIHALMPCFHLASQTVYHSIQFFPMGNWKNASTGFWHSACSLQVQPSQEHTCTLAKLVFTGTKGRRKDILKCSKFLLGPKPSPPKIFPGLTEVTTQKPSWSFWQEKHKTHRSFFLSTSIFHSLQGFNSDL